MAWRRPPVKVTIPQTTVRGGEAPPGAVEIGEKHFGARGVRCRDLRLLIGRVELAFSPLNGIRTF